MYAIPGQTPAAAAAAPEPQATAPAARSVAQVLAESNVLAVLDDANNLVKVIKAVGNYGEMYTRNIGPLGLARGQNALWTKGGLLFTPPFQ